MIAITFNNITQSLHIMRKKIALCFLIFSVLIVLSMFLLYQNTGFLQTGEIDVLDEKNWDYANGIIPGSQAIEFHGTSGQCWVLVHGYTSTPDELRELALAIHIQFNDSVYVPRLYGHGEQPSHLEKYSVNEWYSQVKSVAEEHNCQYLLGSSMGASIVLKYAETHNPTAIILFGIMLKPQPDYLPILSFTKIIAPFARYTKKVEPGGTVQDLAGKKAHLSTWTFPLKGAVELAEFNKNVLANLDSIRSKVLFLHASQDTVASPKAAQQAYNQLQTEKQFIFLDQGNHIIMRDYEKSAAIAHVLNFRKK